MHVELGGEVTVQNGVDVLKMVSTSVLVKRIGLGVGSVPATTATSCSLRSNDALAEDGRGGFASSEQLGHQW